MNALTKSIILCLLLLTQACSSTEPHAIPSMVMPKLMIAEPMPVNYQHQVAIARLSDIIQRAELTKEQRAELLYDRGIRYDNLGLTTLARLDFNRALRLKPDLANVYNLLGIHYIQLQEFMQAYDAFDSALDLKPEHTFALFNRGIALYYGGRAALAVDDFTEFYQQKLEDPYRLLWLYFAQYNVDKVKAQQLLKQKAQNVADNVWAKTVIKLALNEISIAEFTQYLTAGINSQKALTERLCEAYFYLGKISLLRHQPNTAANYFKLALSTNVYDFVEHRYASLELELARESKQSSAIE